MSLCWQGWCLGQQAFTVTGIDVSGGNGKMSATVGQVDYGVVSDGGVSLISGVQQPFDVLVPTATDPLPDVLPGITLYPNPSSRFIILKYNGEKYGELLYRLVDSDGKELERAPVQQPETIISLDHYKPSAYFVIVMKHSKILKIFKIIKN